MPLFHRDHELLTPVPKADFADEKELQRLVENNLDAVFKCRFVETEFATGQQHSGRIDTLALSEDNNPIIIEYKRVPSSDLINQSLFYLSWLHDHHGDFEIAAQKALGPGTTVDWAEIRVICIAPSYRKYDLHAVHMMGTSIELWSYRLFANGALFMEEVFQATGTAPLDSGKNPVMVAAGKKAAITRTNSSWTFEEHVDGKPEAIRELAVAIQEFVTDLDSAIEESPKKFYVAYRTSQNIVCMEVQKHKLLLFVKLDPTKVSGPEGISRDVTDIGHYGTGDLEVTIKSRQDVEATKPFLRMAYERLGG